MSNIPQDRRAVTVGYIGTADRIGSEPVVRLGKQSGHHYLLDANLRPVRCDDLLTWAQGMDDSRRRSLLQDSPHYGVLVSTVFLGINHSWSGGEPILFETMVFGDPDYDELQLRYASWEQATRGHQLVLNHVREPIWSRWLSRALAPLIGTAGESLGRIA